MTDIVPPLVRSRMMSGIRAKNTKPELVIRKALHKLGFRYRLHAKHLPGKPDLVLPKYKAIIFIHGCFWHGHNCHLFRWPATRPEFWREKISRNQKNDVLTEEKLLDNGWRVCKVWECAIRGNGTAFTGVVNEIAQWLKDDTSKLEISRVGFEAAKTSRAAEYEGLQDEESTMDANRK
jgi:DNA mismatch endonuclease (patch repair protein)